MWWRGKLLNFVNILFAWKSQKSSHFKLRKAACYYIQKHIEDFAGVLEYENDPEEYLKKMKKSGIRGGRTEIKVLASIVKRNILILCCSQGSCPLCKTFYMLYF